MATDEATNLIIKDNLINNTNLLALVGGGQTALHSHAGGGAFTSQCSVYLSGDQTIAHATTTLIDFDTEDYDNNTEFNTTTHLWTAKTNGYYTVHANIGWINSDNDTEPHSLHIYVDGAEVGRNSLFQGIEDGVMFTQITKDLYLTIGQTVAIWGYQACGGNRDIDSRSTRSWMSIRRFA